MHTCSRDDRGDRALHQLEASDCGVVIICTEPDRALVTPDTPTLVSSAIYAADSGRFVLRHLVPRSFFTGRFVVRHKLRPSPIATSHPSAISWTT